MGGRADQNPTSGPCRSVGASGSARDRPASGDDRVSCAGSGELTELERFAVETIGHRFRRHDLLVEALTHPSAKPADRTGSRGADNQRLELLGDAVLELLVTERLFLDHPDEGEGPLTTRRSHLVCCDHLAEVAAACKLHAHLILDASLRGQPRRSAMWRGILADAFEAIVGAVFLDGGIESARAVVAAHLFPGPNVEATRGADRRPPAASRGPSGRPGGAAASPVPLRDAKSRLQELTQGSGLGRPAYRMVDRTGPDHAPSFVAEVTVAGRVLGRGTGQSLRVAEQAAAEQAIATLARESSPD